MKVRSTCSQRLIASAEPPTARSRWIPTRAFRLGQGGSLHRWREDRVPGDGLVRACRMRKSAAELALLQSANDVTLAALRHVHAQVRSGMRNSEIEDLVISTTEALGGTHLFTLVLLNEASAFPHGSVKPQQVHAGSVILIDTGCEVHGYQSDISRSWVFGEPSARQRELWNTVKRGQEIALETARIGVAVGAIDKAVRDFYESKGWSRNYGLPGSRTARATASAWRDTRRRTWCAVTRRRLRVACASRTSRGFMSPASSASGSRIAGT